MKISVKMIDTAFSGQRCYTHARGAFAPDGFGVITTQPLRLSGSDIFYGVHVLKTSDGGESWSDIMPCKNLGRQSLADGSERVIADGTPFYHKKSGKILLIGTEVFYENDEAAGPRESRALYSIYDRESGEFSELRTFELPQLGDEYFCCVCGSTQCFEEESGDILLPVMHYSLRTAENLWQGFISSSVIRAGFDGERLYFKEIGAPLTLNIPRGLYEPSIMRFGGKYYLCMRGDTDGYIASSSDGLNFGEPRALVFDDGESVGNYNTQQHWIRLQDKLFLVYTRRGANNDHVFRHRAPLFIAEVDTEKLCLIRHTERVAVECRGARLGNFGCAEVGENLARVIVSEWMQGPNGGGESYKECMKYGSNNSIFISEISL